MLHVFRVKYAFAVLGFRADVFGVRLASLRRKVEDTRSPVAPFSDYPPRAAADRVVLIFMPGDHDRLVFV